MLLRAEYRGPISLNNLEEALGDFDRVRLRLVEGSVLPMSPGHQQLTTHGLVWPCGCESRGTTTPDSYPTCSIASCSRHRHEFEELPIREVEPDPPITVVMERAEATLKPGDYITLDVEAWRAAHPEILGNADESGQLM